MEIRESIPHPRSACTNRMEHQASIGFTSHLGTRWMQDFVFAFHDGDEIGPKMLARVAKKTGLTPEDI